MRDGGVCSNGVERWWRRVSVLAIALAGWAAPEPALAATAIEVEAGYAGSYVPGRPAPVRVRVTADRLLSGELQVVADGPPTAIPIEVPGGTTKEFLVVVPTTLRSGGRLEVTARLADGTRSPPTASASVSAVIDQETVGLLPGALAGRALPATAPLAVDAGTARFVALGPLELEQAPDSLETLGTIGVAADELARQSPTARDALLRWVEDGGRLLVDAPLGSPVAGLPDEWQPGVDGRARAGAGEIRLTSGAMAGGRWPGLIEPTSRPARAASSGIGSPPLGDLLASEAGFRLPRISWLVGFLVLYVVVVGPVLYVVLTRRRRPELAWVAIPLIAVVFTGGSYAAGRTLRNATPVVHGTVIDTGSQGSAAITYLGVSSRSGGTARLAYPAGWMPDELYDGSDRGSKLTSVRVTGSGLEARLPLDAGQFAVVSAHGPASVEGALEITATSDADGGVRGTIRNGTRLHLEGVSVMSGNGTSRLGSLDAGEERTWSVQTGPHRGGPPSDFELLGPQGGNDQRKGWTNIALWNAAHLSGLVSRVGGQAVAVGWTRDFSPPVKVGGHQPKGDGQTLVVGSAPVALTGSRATDAAVRTELVRTATGPGRETVVRFGLPSAAHQVDPSRLRLRIPMPQAEVWTGGEWTALNCGPPACQPAPGLRCPPGVACPDVPNVVINGPFAEMQAPAGSVRDGAVYLRFRGGPPPFATSEFAFGLREIP